MAYFRRFCSYNYILVNKYLYLVAFQLNKDIFQNKIFRTKNDLTLFKLALILYSRCFIYF